MLPLLNSLLKNISKNKCMTFDRPVLDCACLKKLKLGRLVGGNWGPEEMEWQAVPSNPRKVQAGARGGSFRREERAGSGLTIIIIGKSAHFKVHHWHKTEASIKYISQNFHVTVIV